MKKIVGMMALLSVMLLTSCSDSDYVSVIPNGSKMLVSVDVGQMMENGNGKGIGNLLQQMFSVDSQEDTGIDFEKDVYLFESPDGLFGLTACLSSESRLNDCLEAMEKQGTCGKLTERKEIRFVLLKSKWLIGFRDQALMVLGPIVPTQQAETMMQMIRYFERAKNGGILQSPIYERLDSIDAPVAMVAQLTSMPEMVAAPLSLGVPKGIDASQVYVEAGMSVHDQLLDICGSLFSPKASVNTELQNANALLRPLKNVSAKNLPDAICTILMNVQGKTFLPLLQSNKTLQTMLIGVNNVIDIDNVIRSVDGDLLLNLYNMGDKIDASMKASLCDTHFMGDIDYWKQSCPKGGKIVEQGGMAGDAYRYSDGHMNLFFGVSGEKERPLFYCATKEQYVGQLLATSSSQNLQNEVTSLMEGKRMGFVMRLDVIDHESLKMVTDLLTPVLGDIKTVVYTRQ